jgi:hypothetical protein
MSKSDQARYMTSHAD